MKEPQISIILPFKNTEPYIEACLESITEQTYDNWELLAVNDHSTDQSREKAGLFSAADSRISVIDNEGCGIIDALRTGYDQSQGAFITRMDSDDIMAAEKLEIMRNQLTDAGTGHVATGLVKYFSDYPLGNGYARYEEWLNSLTREGSNFSDIYKECPIPSPCWMVARQDFEVAGAFDSNAYPEDYDLCFRFMESGLNCLPSSKTLHYWRDYGERTSRNDEHYADNRFLSMKVDYFMKLHRIPEMNLKLWGAGRKGKAVAKLLIEKNVEFQWITNNPKKIGKDIYGIKLAYELDEKLEKNDQLLLTIAIPEAQIRIQNIINQSNLERNSNYFWLC